MKQNFSGEQYDLCSARYYVHVKRHTARPNIAWPVLVQVTSHVDLEVLNLCFRSRRDTGFESPFSHRPNAVVCVNLLNYRYDTSAVINAGTINNTYIYVILFDTERRQPVARQLFTFLTIISSPLSHSQNCIYTLRGAHSALESCWWDGGGNGIHNFP